MQDLTQDFPAFSTKFVRIGRKLADWICSMRLDLSFYAGREIIWGGHWALWEEQAVDIGAICRIGFRL